MTQSTNSHIFTNKDGNTLMKEFEGVLQHNPQIRCQIWESQMAKCQ